jgi:hypothetical protein
VPGIDTLLNGHDLCPDNRILASKDVEAEPRGRWNAIILLDIFSLSFLGFGGANILDAFVATDCDPVSQRCAVTPRELGGGTMTAAVPGPVVGAGLPGLILAGERRSPERRNAHFVCGSQRLPMSLSVAQVYNRAARFTR